MIGDEEQVSNNALKDLAPSFNCPAVLDIGKTISILQSLDQPASKRFCGPQLLQQSISSGYSSSHIRHRNSSDNIILRPYASSVWKTPRYSNGSTWKRRSARASSLTSSECEYNQGNRLSPPHSPVLRPASESHAMFSSMDWNHANTPTSSPEKVTPVVKANGDNQDRNEHVSRFTVTRCKSQPCFPTEDNKDNKRHQLKRQRSDEGLLMRPALDFMKMKEVIYFIINVNV